MLKSVAALAGACLLILPAALAAQPAPQRQSPPPAQQQQQHQQQRGPAQQPNYGTWNDNWGPRPSAPPSHWEKTGDWYRHVRACQQRYRSYNPRTDTYRAYSGRDRRCTL